MAGWHLAIGKRSDGSEIELMRGTSPPDRGKPMLLSTTYTNARWRKLIQNIGGPLDSNYLPMGYTRWLLEDYKRRHPDDPLVEVSLIHVRQRTYGPYDAEPPSEEAFQMGYTAEGIFFSGSGETMRRWRLENGKIIPVEMQQAKP
jgi:hypothetical protein